MSRVVEDPDLRGLIEERDGRIVLHETAGLRAGLAAVLRASQCAADRVPAGVSSVQRRSGHGDVDPTTQPSAAPGALQGAREIGRVLQIGSVRVG